MATSPVPAVSVLMTCYNRERFVGEAIESVLASTYEDFELVIVDDGSSDSTRDIAARYASADPRIRMHANQRNLGDYPNRQMAASLARGNYIKYVDSDDVIYPHGLAAMMSCMDDCPEAALGLSALPDSAGPCPIILSPREAYEENFFVRGLLERAPGSCIIKRSAFEAVGGFSGKRQVGDHELWLKLAARYPVVKMPTDLVWDRHHPEQEKHYDSAAEKDAMHDEVRLAALDSDACPLDAEMRKKAVERMKEIRAKTFFRIAFTDGVASAFRYRRVVDLRLRTIAGVGLGIKGQHTRVDN